MEANALEQFLILAKQAKGRAAVVLVQQAISSPSLYHFGELLEHENIAAIAATPDGKPWHDLLQIFAYGTFPDYRARQGSLPPLDEAAALKLKQLTVVSLAAQNKVIPYAALLRDLELQDTRTVEDVIIEGMYAGLYKGKLDQKKKEFQLHETAGRDCRPGQIDDMIATLQAWCQAAENISGELADKITYANDAQEAEAARVKEMQARVEDVKKSLQSAHGDMDAAAPGAGHAESMETDDPVSRPKSKLKTKHPSAALPGARH
mmetsp:Transcript_46451/g.92939  ORF Transcript_46451/g.92939 Transcript_46451/m.92939 type:complete len:263 (+) Transcript_46451:100-888(+)